MTNQVLRGEEFINLLNSEDKNCLSLIIPTHKLPNERHTDKLKVKSMIEKAELLIDNKYDKTTSKLLIDKLNQIAEKIDYNHNMEGIGIFVSENQSMRYSFPFKVSEKMVAGNSFEIRDLLYHMQLTEPLSLIMLTEKHIRLFLGDINGMNEIRGKEFPSEFVDLYEYSTPSRGSSSMNPQMKSFEHEKSTLEATRFINFIRHTDKSIKPYITGNTKIVIFGSSKLLHYFKENSELAHQVIGEKEGNYDYLNLEDLKEKTTEILKDYLHRNISLKIDDLKEKIGTSKAVSGLQEVWSVAQEGRGLELFVEKDFRTPGFLEKGKELFIQLHPPKTEHITITDAVDDLIELVMDKGGKVFFTEDDELSAFGRIAMTTRY